MTPLLRVRFPTDVQLSTCFLQKPSRFFHVECWAFLSIQERNELTMNYLGIFGVILSNPIFVTDGINHRNTLFSSDLFINCRPLEEFTFSLINLDPFSWIVHQMLVMIPPENDGHENRCMWLSPWMAVILLGVAFFLVILSTIFWRMVVGTFSNQQTIKTNMEAKMEVDGRWCSFSCWWFSGCFAVSLLEVILP